MSLPKVSRFSTGAKILTLQIVICILLLASGLIVFDYLEKVATVEANLLEASRAKSTRAALDGELKDLKYSVAQVQQFLQDISATRGLDGLDDGFANAEEHAKAFKMHIDKARTLAQSLSEAETQKALDDVEQQFAPYYEAGKRMAQAYVAVGPLGGNRMMADFDAVAEKMSVSLDTAVETNAKVRTRIESEEAAAAEKTKADQTFFQTLMVAFGAFTIACAFAASLFTALLQRQARLQQQRAEELNRQQTEEREARAKEAHLVISNLSEGLNRLSNGDLSAQIATRFPGELDRLRAHFNTSIRALADTMGSVLETTSQIKAGTSEIADASGDLARRTETQAASLEETAATISQLTNTLKETAENSTTAKLAAISAKDAAIDGSTVVKEAMVSMREISDSSEEMNKIIGVIEELAFQTNLLALNAGVEAARAGDAGRGFAVVATEVRALSDRSAAAAKDIKALLDNSNAKVERGVKLVADVGASLTKITDKVASVAVTIEGINATAVAQADSLREVNQAVDELDKVTQANAAMVEQATAATFTLNRQTEQLNSVVGRFKTAGGQAA
ncbi:methyl-accepting chemotaxis protein [Aestuariivirga sp.]|uniref:methyl-accepting chemotaxis protein n=1 Tax=Aestuariivirga sp. TaxID=2650926 RepID=UPI0039E5A94D